MNKGNLMQALPIVAAAYGRKFGVKVQVGGTRACTDGKTIHIPEIRDEPVAKTLAWGYLTHEAAHVRFTDMEVYRATAIKSPLVKTVLNILEDVRIENAILGPYPGSVRTLDETLGWLVHEGKTMAAKEGDSPPRVLSAFLLTCCGIACDGKRSSRSWPRHRSACFGKPFRPASSIACWGFSQKSRGWTARRPPPTWRNASWRSSGRRRRSRCPLRRSPTMAVENTTGTGWGPGIAQRRARTTALQAILSAGEDDLPEDLFAAVAEALNAQTAGTSTPLLPSLENYEGDAGARPYPSRRGERGVREARGKAPGPRPGPRHGQDQDGEAGTCIEYPASAPRGGRGRPDFSAH